MVVSVNDTVDVVIVPLPVYVSYPLEEDIILKDEPEVVLFDRIIVNEFEYVDPTGCKFKVINEKSLEYAGVSEMTTPAPI